MMIFGTTEPTINELHKEFKISPIKLLMSPREITIGIDIVGNLELIDELILANLICDALRN